MKIRNRMNFSKMKIFSHRKYLEKGEEHAFILYPFWGKNPEHFYDPDKGRFDVYTREGKKYFTTTSLEDCDLVIFPGSYKKESLKAQQLIKDAKAFNKPIIIFLGSDSDEKIPVKNSYIFRTSFYRSTRKPNEFALPAWSEDFVKKHLNSRLPIRKKSKRPAVSFCGYSPMLRSKKMFSKTVRKLKDIKMEIFLKIKKQKYCQQMKSQIRTRAIKLLSKSPLIKTNFIIRDKFWGGACKDGQLDLEKVLEFRKKLRKEYVDNLIKGDYVLCARGGGNFSYRLYETLNCGRIPLFINTDCVLPYENHIDWKKICVWIDAKEIKSIAKKVYRFHNSLSSKQFVKLQKTCRKIWEEWISPQGFFKNFYRHFDL